jgi:hypothetical protein
MSIPDERKARRKLFRSLLQHHPPSPSPLCPNVAKVLIRSQHASSFQPTRPHLLLWVDRSCPRIFRISNSSKRFPKLVTVLPIWKKAISPLWSFKMADLWVSSLTTSFGTSWNGDVRVDYPFQLWSRVVSKESGVPG